MGRNNSNQQGSSGSHSTFGTVVQVLSFLASLMVIAVGITSVCTSFKKWCYPDDYPGLEIACVGPSLFWNAPFVEHSGTDSDLNKSGWRTVFTLAPERFVDLWTPVCLGFLTLFMHINSLRWHTISANWLRVSVWLTFVALFGCFGYTGQFGVVTGFYCSFVAFLCLVLHFLAPNEKPVLDTEAYLPLASS